MNIGNHVTSLISVNDNMAIPYYLMASYAYYKEDDPLFSDDFYDILSSFEDVGGVKKVSIYLRYPVLFPLIAFGLMILTFVV